MEIYCKALLSVVGYTLVIAWPAMLFAQRAAQPNFKPGIGTGHATKNYQKNNHSGVTKYLINAPVFDLTYADNLNAFNLPQSPEWNNVKSAVINK